MRHVAVVSAVLVIALVSALAAQEPHAVTAAASSATVPPEQGAAEVRSPTADVFTPIRIFPLGANRGPFGVKPVVPRPRFPFALPVRQDSHASKPADAVPPGKRADMSFEWSAAIRQSMAFLGVQHAYAMTQPKTQRAMKGPFFRDYVRSVKSLGGWSDGGKFFTNYIAHPMQGSFMAFIQVHNDPRGRGLQIGKSASYIKSRAKAFAWAAVWSTQFEIGPISQASIGNVGLSGKQTYVDLLITPTVGIAVLMAEDAFDRFLIRRIERMSRNFYLRILARMILNPTRTMANVIRMKNPWHRDPGLR